MSIEKKAVVDENTPPINSDKQKSNAAEDGEAVYREREGEKKANSNTSEIKTVKKLSNKLDS